MKDKSPVENIANTPGRSGADEEISLTQNDESLQSALSTRRTSEDVVNDTLTSVSHSLDPMMTVSQTSGDTTQSNRSQTAPCLQHEFQRSPPLTPFVGLHCSIPTASMHFNNDLLGRRYSKRHNADAIHDTIRIIDDVLDILADDTAKRQRRASQLLPNFEHGNPLQ